jgi:hypothetical protein
VLFISNISWSVRVPQPSQMKNVKC